MHNPSLHEYPRKQPARVIPNLRGESVLEWLESSGRMMPREKDEKELTRDEEAEINALMAGDDGFEDDDDDDDLEVED
ncbi:MAG: DUF3134 domain-containing protein [Elainellaceae cyanobacterium]